MPPMFNGLLPSDFKWEEPIRDYPAFHTESKRLFTIKCFFPYHINYNTLIIVYCFSFVPYNYFMHYSFSFIKWKRYTLGTSHSFRQKMEMHAVAWNILIVTFIHLDPGGQSRNIVLWCPIMNVQSSEKMYELHMFFIIIKNIFPIMRAWYNSDTR